MITIGDKQLRNLEEQVLKNKEDIARHYEIDRALANLGIKVVGQVTSADDLPDPTTYTGSYGDAYAVGNKEEVDAGTSTYVYYVYTRPDPNAGIYENQWLDVGKISIEGPQGPQGPQGEQGPAGESTKWYVGISAPAETEGYNEGDMFLNMTTTGPTGYVYRFDGNGWFAVGSIRGPQGIQGRQGIQGIQGIQGEQGPKGDTGDVGGFINIAGIVANEGQLPTPESLDNLTIAYLVGAAEPYNLWIQVGSTSATAVWTDMGLLNVATYVTVNGQYQNVWDADTKVDRTNESYKVYGTGGTGNQTTWNVSYSGSTGGSIPIRSTDGNLLVPLSPVSENSATSKKYVDDGLNNKLDKKTTLKCLYGTDSYGEQKMYYIAVTPSGGTDTIPIRYTNGNILVPETPTGDAHATSKIYVDTALDGKLDKVTTAYRVYGTNAIGEQQLWQFASEVINNSIVFRSTTGYFDVNAPTADNHPANKKYVDDKATMYKHILGVYVTVGGEDVLLTYYAESLNSTIISNTNLLPLNALETSNASKAIPMHTVLYNNTLLAVYYVPSTESIELTTVTDFSNVAITPIN